AANRRQADLALELRRREAEARDHESQLDILAQARAADIEERLAQHRMLARFVEGLPQIALALKQEVGSLTVTQLGGDPANGPLNAVPAAFAQLLALAKSFGLELPKSHTEPA